jgi:DDE superfamily endonuclease
MPTRRRPRSVTSLLERFRGCFTAPTFEVFCALTVGFWAQPQAHTVTGMLMAAGLSATWHHSRAHRFFSAARWSADQLGVVLLDLILAVLVPAGAPVRLVVDDTLFRRSGRKVFAAAWHHDPLGVGRNAVAWGNNWVVVGVLVDLPFLPHRPVCLPILARLWWPKHTPGRLDLATDLVTVICQHLGPRRVDLLCDGAYAGKALRELPCQVTVTTRLRADAALYQLPPPRRPGQRGRPPTKGARLPDLTRLAGLQATPFALHQASLYGKPRTLAVAGFTCLWPSVFATRPVHVVLVRDPTAPDGFDLALVSTDLAATAHLLVCRYATRWPIEVSFRDARQHAGVGQARNRTRLAVERTVPFGLVCFSLAVVWYATCGHAPADLAARRALAPWYQTKTAPSAQDMLVKLRRVLIAAQYRPAQPSTPTMAEILQVQAAWTAAAG